MKDASNKSVFWNCYARCYDGLLETVPYQRLIAQTLAHIPATATRLLDAGCGTGNLLRAARETQPQLALAGIDFSHQMLRRAADKVPTATLSRGDLNQPLPFADGSFDVVTCVNVLYAVENPEKTVSELRRVLAPGGRLIMTSPKSQPRLTAFITEHAETAGWWKTLPMLGRMLVLILFNLLILRRGRKQTYHFLDTDTVKKLLSSDISLHSAYSGQNWFATLTKGVA